ncbi:hypothetical protein Tco_0014486 [Tanacetum coccineum]
MISTPQLMLVDSCEMWKAIERLKQGDSINVQDLETNLYWEFGKFTSRDGESLESYYSRFYKMMNELVKNQCHVTNHQVNVQFLLQLQPEWQSFIDLLKQHQNEVNEIRAERLARTVNPLALVAQQQPVYHHQNHPTQNTQYSSTYSNSQPETKEKQLLHFFQHLLICKKSGIQYYQLQEYGHVSRECQKPKRVKDAAYHKEKMLLCKQEEAGVQLNAEQADWKDDTDDESEEQELEAHYMYMAQLQEVTPDSVDNSGPIFDDEPMHKCVLNDNHDLCVLHYINGVNSRTRQPMAVPVSTREPKHKMNQSVATSSKKTFATDSTVKKSRKSKLVTSSQGMVMATSSISFKLPTQSISAFKDNIFDWPSKAEILFKESSVFFLLTAESKKKVLFTF